MTSSPPPLSRRTLLRSAGAAAAAAAGCITISSGSDETTYRLHLHPMGDSLAAALRWEPPSLYAEQDRRLMDRLIEEGALATERFSLHSPAEDHPAYVGRDGTYHEIEADRGPEVERERWELWFELLDGPPGDDATVVEYEGATDELSEQDEHAFESAFSLSEWGPMDVSDDDPGSRGHVFVRPDAEDSNLLPEPPFTHVHLEWGDDEHYLRARTERVTVTLRRIDHTAEAVADSSEALEAYVVDEHVAATFDENDDDDVLAIVRRNREYEEEAPISDAYERVFERLGLDDVEVPEPKRVEFSEDVFFAREDGYVRSQLEILN